MAAVSLTLPRAALVLLSQLIAAPGLATEPLALVRLGTFAETHCADLKPPKDAEALDAWEKEKVTIETTPATFEAIKAMIGKAAEKGMLSGHRAILAVLRAFELGKEP